MGHPFIARLARSCSNLDRSTDLYSHQYCAHRTPKVGLGQFMAYKMVYETSTSISYGHLLSITFGLGVAAGVESHHPSHSSSKIEYTSRSTYLPSLHFASLNLPSS